MKILGYEIPIIIAKDPLGSNYCGQWSTIKGEITIDEALKPEIIEETKLHEVIEGINNICDLGLDHKSISVLSAVLHKVFVDNGPISDWR